MPLTEDRNIRLDRSVLAAAAASGKVPGSRRGAVEPVEVRLDPARGAVTFVHADGDPPDEVSGATLGALVIGYLLSVCVPLPKGAAKRVTVGADEVVLNVHRVHEPPTRLVVMEARRR